MATITGGSGPDTLFGTNANDAITAYAGNDRVSAGAGNDKVNGNSGNDTLRGGDDADRLDGGADSDALEGESGDDILLGGDGNDSLQGGPGNDFFDGGAGNDVLNVGNQEGPEFDTVLGGDGDDLLYVGSLPPHSTGLRILDGGNGNDTLSCSFLSSSSERILGGDGDDEILYIGYGSVDEVDAGAGNDSVLMAATVGVVSVVTLGAGSDVLKLDDTFSEQVTITDFAPGAGGDKIDLDRILINLVGSDGSNPFGDGFLRLRQSAADVLLEVDRDGAASGALFTTLVTFESVSATAFTVDNFVPAFAPDGSPPPGRTIRGTKASDTLHGTAGNDVIVAYAGDDLVLGEAGSDLIDAGVDDDWIDGGVGNDSLRGGIGNDTLTGGSGNDLLEGGDGNDEFFIGVDDNSDNDTLKGGAGDDRLSGDDCSLTGGATLLLDGGDGNDTLYGARGLAAAPSGAKVLFFGGNGDDFIRDVGRNRSDSVDAGAGNDEIWLSQVNGHVSTIVLGAGNDTLAAGIGIEHQAEITDFATGAGGDLIDFGLVPSDLVGYDRSNPFRDGFVRLRQDGSDTLLEVDRDAGSSGSAFVTLLTFRNIDAASFSAANFHPGFSPDGAEYFVGFLGNDHFLGSAAADTAGGYDGNDELLGEGGADTLSGGNGADTLFGGTGKDVLDGGPGDDSMVGGDKEDNYFVDSAGDKVVELAGAMGIADTVNTTLNVYSLGANVERVVFTGTGNFAAAGNVLDNRFLGGTGDDRFVTSAGADVFQGGLGGDTVDYRTAAIGAALDFSTNFHGGAAAGDSFSSIEKFLGSSSAGDNVLGAGLGRYTISGYGGADTLSGGGNIDQLLGGDGDDQLFGAAGKDTLSGDAGDDTLTGGEDRDFFQFAFPPIGQDVVADFQVGLDLLKVHSSVAASLADFTIAGNGTTSVVLSLLADPAQTITLNGAAAIFMTAADFAFY